MSNRPQHIVRLTSVPSEMEAGIVVAALEQDGIQATMAGQATAGFRAEAPGQVHVLIAKEDFPRAQTVLDELRHDTGAIDWSQVDYGEPEEHDDVGEAGMAAEPVRTGPSLWSRVAQAAVVVAILVILLRLLIGVFR